MSVRSQLPPGPRQPAAVQTIGWWVRPVAFLERARARYVAPSNAHNGVVRTISSVLGLAWTS